MVGDGEYGDSPDDGDGRTHGMQRGAGRGRLLLPRRRSLLPAARLASQPRATRHDCCSSSATRQLRSHAGMYTRPSGYFSTPVRNRVGGRCEKRRTARFLPRDPIVRWTEIVVDRSNWPFFLLHNSDVAPQIFAKWESLSDLPVNASVALSVLHIYYLSAVRWGQLAREAMCALSWKA